MSLIRKLSVFMTGKVGYVKKSTVYTQYPV